MPHKHWSSDLLTAFCLVLYELVDLADQATTFLASLADLRLFVFQLGLPMEVKVLQ